MSIRSRDRITEAIDDQRTVRLAGNRHPLASPENDDGLVDAEQRLERMILTLRPDPRQQEALDELLRAQHDPSSPLFQRWLTNEQFAERFGVSKRDASLIAGWLRRRGFDVEEVSASRQMIVFSGTVGQIRGSFHTEIRKFRANGEEHIANALDPEIPAALSEVVGGIVTMHDFRRQPMHAALRNVGSGNGASAPSRGGAGPNYTAGTSHYMAPADFATIYNVTPLYARGIDGTGQKVAIVGRTNIALSDIRLFRSSMGLPAQDPIVLVNGPNPGNVGGGEETEADLDVEWSGAVAPKATINFVVSGSTNSTDGVDLSSSYIVNNNVAPVMSISFGSCEAAMGTSENNFYNSLWQQAAAKGITVFVSSGDSGAAGCDWGNSANSSHGRGVNGLCSPSYSVCVGGTQFSEGSNTGLYWSPSNVTSTRGSALTYIPEVAWNESGSNGGYGLWATGGGASILYAKPSWQVGAGVPADGHRDVPDVSLTAAGHDAYLIYQGGNLGAVSGTSASSPSFAGLMALVNQNAASSQGNANTAFYALANKQALSGGAVYFHRVTGGNNTVPGLEGFTSTANYNQATGLGSVDANAIVTNWGDATSGSAPRFTLTPAATTATVALSGSVAVGSSVAVSNGFNSDVALSIAGLPSGVTASFSPGTIAAPGSGTTILTLSAASSAATGTYQLTITATGNGQNVACSLTLSVTGPTFSLSSDALEMTVRAAASGSVNIITAGTAGFSGAVTLSVSGAPSGVTATFSKTTIASPGTGSSLLTVAAAPGVISGTYSLVVTAVSGATSKTINLKLMIPEQPGCTLRPSGAGGITISYGSAASFQVSCVSVTGGFHTTMQVTAAGALAGTAVTVTPSTLVPGTGVSTVTIQPSSSATAGTSTLVITATGGGVTATLNVSLTVVHQPDYLFAVAPHSLSIAQGASGVLTVATSHVTDFNARIDLGIASPLPSGLTATFGKTAIPAPGDGSTTVTFAADPKMTPGTYTVLVRAAGMTLTKASSVTISVMGVPGIGVTTASRTLAAVPGATVATTISTSAVSGFNGAVKLSLVSSGASALPSGVTAIVSSPQISAPGNGTSALSLKISDTVTPGTYVFRVIATSGTITAQSEPVTVTVAAPPSFQLAVIVPGGTPSASVALSVTRNSSAALTVQSTAISGFNSSIALTVTGVPAGVTAAFTPTSITGSATSTLRLAVTTSAKPGTQTIKVTATSGAISRTVNLALTVR